MSITINARPLTVRIYNAGTRNMPQYDPSLGYLVGNDSLGRRRVRINYRNMRAAGVPRDAARSILIDLLSLGAHGEFASVFPCFDRPVAA